MHHNDAEFYSSYIKNLADIMILSIVASLKWLLRVLVRAANKFWWDDCFSRAASLAYTSLFALVPATAIMFGFQNGFNFDSQFVDDRLGGFLQQLLPPGESQILIDLKTQLIGYLKELGEIVRALGALSLPVIFISGIALVNTIESSLNAVWRVSTQMGLTTKFMSFWTIVTLGPLSVYTSFYWYTRVTSMSDFQTSGAASIFNSNLFAAFDFVIPVFLIFFMLTLVFCKLPSQRVYLRDGMLGALVSAILFELLKRGFAYYISVSATYRVFYGVLVSLPLFLFWLYLVWVVVLFGAQVAYQAGSLTVLTGLRKYASELGEIGGLLGLRILCVIGSRFREGKAVPTESEIAVETGSDPVLVRTCLGILAEAGLITAADPDSHARSLLVAPDKLTLGEVALAFRSKGFRKKEKETGELQFVESLRATSKIVDPTKAVKNWTLSDVLFGSDRACKNKQRKESSE